MDANAGFVVAGYLLTAAALGGYLALLRVRARAARRAADSAAARRRA
jgi:hypothetical protein